QHMARVEPRLPGAQVIFPAMPWATHDLARAAVLKFADTRRAQKTERVAETQRPALMRTAIQDREVFTFDVEHANRATVEFDDLACAGLNLVDGRDNVFRHSGQAVSSWRGLAVCTARGRFRTSDCARNRRAAWSAAMPDSARRSPNAGNQSRTSISFPA